MQSHPTYFHTIRLVIVKLVFTAISLSAGERKVTLEAALKGADRIEVKLKDIEFGHQEVPNKPFVFSDAEKIANLVSKLDFDDKESGFHCMCYGDATVTFFKGREKLAELSHHHGRSLRWNSGKWQGDSLFTPEAGTHWREWFRENGFKTFHEKHEAELKRKAEEQRLQLAFLSHFPKHIRPLFTDRTADMYEHGDWDTMKKEVREKLLNDLRRGFDGEAELARALCAAFGELNGSGDGSWGSACNYMFLGQWAGKSLDPVEFARVIGELKEPQELLGAARLFFQEGLGKQLKRADWERLTARLGGVTLRHDKSGNAAYAFRIMSGVVSPDVDELLQEVASGRLVVEPDLRFLGDDPAPRATACLTLAMHGQPAIKDLARRLLEDVKAGSSDEAALKLSQYQLGDRTMWPNRIFEIRSDYLGESGLKVLAKEGSKEALDRIINDATEHPYAATREQAVLVVERLTGKRWFMGHEDERAEWHAKEIREWWAEAKKTWPDDTKPDKPDKAEHANPPPRRESKPE